MRAGHSSIQLQASGHKPYFFLLVRILWKRELIYDKLNRPDKRLNIGFSIHRLLQYGFLVALSLTRSSEGI